VARRRVRDPHLAEDVAQAAFIVLARKAQSLRAARATALPAWLFHVTRLAASRALRDEARRRRRETEAALRLEQQRGATDESAEMPWQEVEPYLDESVASLRASDREAVLLRFYQRKTFGEVADAIGATEDAARKRVSRAVGKLRQRLARRGVAVPGAAAFATAMWNHTTQAAAPALVNSIATGAVCTSNLITSAAPSVALAKGAMNMIFIQKAKTAAAAAVALILVGMLGVALVAQARAQHGSPAKAPVARAAAQPATSPADAVDPADAHAAAADKMKVTQVIPILQVNDLQASLEYYVDKLGFEMHWTHGDPASFAAIGRDGMMIFLQQDPQSGGGPTVIYMVVTDVDDLHAGFAQRGADIVHAPEDRPWGMREMIVKDLDENQIRVGTMSGQATEPVKEPVKPKGK
jgi:RNA polymerase sigma factor (sigma-70 family)